MLSNSGKYWSAMRQSGFSRNSTNMWLVFNMSGTPAITPQIWYSTNITTNEWFEMTDTWATTNGNVCTQWFNIMTSEKNYFLRISTNSGTEY